MILKLYNQFLHHRTNFSWQCICAGEEGYIFLNIIVNIGYLISWIRSVTLSIYYYNSSNTYSYLHISKWVSGILLILSSNTRPVAQTDQRNTTSSKKSPLEQNHPKPAAPVSTSKPNTQHLPEAAQFLAISVLLESPSFGGREKNKTKKHTRHKHTQVLFPATLIWSKLATIWSCAIPVL